MCISPILVPRAVLLALTLVISSAAFSQGATTSRNVCNRVGGNLVEPVGDGRGIQVSTFSCRVEGGPMAGAVLSGSQIYEFQGASGVMLSGSGIVRKAGSTLVYQNVDGRTTLSVTDGKVTGATGAGKGVYKAAYGAIASAAGKSYSYKVTASGPNEFVIEVADD